MAFAAALLLLLGLSSVSTPSPWNASAEAVAQGSGPLGIDFGQGEGNEGRAIREANQALSRAGVGAWLDAQIDDESAAIGEPPAALRESLEQNRDALWSVVAALERDNPEWGPRFGKDGYVLLKPFLPVLRLERVIVAAALVEAREGRSIEAGRALEAAWILARSISAEDLFSQLVGMNAERMQVGALRKLPDPPPQWLGRLSSDGPWTRLPKTLREEVKLRPRNNQEPDQRMFRDVAEKMYEALADSLEKLSPCDPILASDVAIWNPAAEALAAEINASKRAIRDFYKESAVELVGSTVRRSARLEVDRELTLKVLQLRLDKEASRDSVWPEKADTTSAVCPGASYSYESTSGAMTLRFLGTVEAPKGSLPLTFGAGASEHAEPTRPPALTPTPAGGMIAPP